MVHIERNINTSSQRASDGLHPSGMYFPRALGAYVWVTRKANTHGCMLSGEAYDHVVPCDVCRQGSLSSRLDVAQTELVSYFLL